MRPAHNSNYSAHRRSRLRDFAAAARGALHLESGSPLVERVADAAHVDMAAELQRRLTPEELSSYLESLSEAQQKTTAVASTAKTIVVASTVKAATTTSTTKAVAAQAATAGTSINKTTVTSVPAPSLTSTVRSTAITSASAVKSSAVVSSAAKSTSKAATSAAIVNSAKAATSTTSAKPSTTSTLASTSSAAVRTVTAPSTSSSKASAAASASASAVVDAASSNMSVGSTIGIVAGVVVGLVVIGSIGGWLYRKYQARGTGSWSKINDDVTPFTSDKHDDVYGATTEAPVIGSRRALALARQNAFAADGSFRPDSDVMLERDGNRAGMGAGTGGGFAPYSAYPTMPDRAAYGVDPQGRPYHPTATRAPLPHTLQNEYEPYDQTTYDPHPLAQPEYAAQPRQLLGPHAHQQYMPAPVPLGRPAAPESYDAMAAHEDFGDLPGPAGSDVSHTQFMRPYDESEPYTPRTATSMSEWSGDARLPARSRVSMATPKAQPELRLPLPQFAPMSPLMSNFDLPSDTKDASLFAAAAPKSPAPAYDSSRRLYGEVAHAAGIPEPVTPVSATLDTSTSSSAHTGDTSFSAPEPAARLPPAHLAPNPPFAAPYQHGQPLSPLQELPTPLSERNSYAMASSEAIHDAYVRGPLPPVQAPELSHHKPAQIIVTSPNDDAAPPYSASTQNSVQPSVGSSVPSPRFPPPSPSGMSVPGSMTDSPRRWDAPGRPVSLGYDEEDAYGGI
ncbi:hypothetical protein Q5752_002552 [Cryptotrichosporon argae]